MKAERITSIFFLLSILFGMYCLSIGWRNPLLDMHGFRQTQTAIGVYFMAQGGPLVAYETPVLGAHWSIPFEFPLYQWTVLGVYKLNRIGLDQAGRLVSALFFYLTLVPLWAILRELKAPRYCSFLLLSTFVLSPLYIFWSRTFMIESTALFIGCSYLAFVLRYLSTRERKFLLGAGLCGALGMVKVTTFATFLIIAGCAWCLSTYRRHKAGEGSVATAPQEFILLFLMPILMVRFWDSFAESQRALNPLARDFLASKNLTPWLFGTFAERFSFDTWHRVVWERVLPDIFGMPWVIGVIALGFMAPSRWTLYSLASVVCFFVSFFTFSHVNIVHNYYQYANALFLVFGVGFSIISLLESNGWRRGIGAAALIVVITSEYRGWRERFYPPQVLYSKQTIRPAQYIRKNTEPDDVILIYGLDWSAEVPYYAKRRAIMDRDMLPLDSPVMKESFERSLPNEKKLAAVLFCNGTQNQKGEVETRVEKLGFNPEPVHKDGLCEIYSSVRKSY